MIAHWLNHQLERLCDALPADLWLAFPPMMRGVIAIVLVSLVCGAVGSLVVSNRMAFLSDALAHCAFAGVTLGMIISLAAFQPEAESWAVPTIMVAFGILVGLGIVFVREHSRLSSDTVIGVFFAFAVGFGAMLLNALRRSSFMDPERFLFGSLLTTSASDLLVLLALAVVLLFVLFKLYNAIVLGSFSPSLAMSRGVRVRLWNYVFIVLLALIVNLCVRAVGALLINALLVVPAATAANLGRGVRAMFWWAIVISLTCGITGLWMSYRVVIPVSRGGGIELVPSGTIVVLCVLAFMVSLVFRMTRDRRAARLITTPVNS